MLQLFSRTLLDENLVVAVHTVSALTSLVPSFGSEEVAPFRTLVEPILSVIERCLAEDEDAASDVLDLFEELVDCEVPLIAPFIPRLVPFFLQLGCNLDLQAHTRVKGLSFVQWLAIRKSKSLVKKNLLRSVLEAMFMVLSASESDPYKEDDEESDYTGQTAAQTIDALASHVPAQIVYPILVCVCVC